MDHDYFRPTFTLQLLSIYMDQCKEEGKDQLSTQSSTTPNPGHHLGK